jgi:hypothetical protein
MHVPTTQLIQDRAITFVALLLHSELALRVGLSALCTLAELMQLFNGRHGHHELPGHLVVHLK